METQSLKSLLSVVWETALNTSTMIVVSRQLTAVSCRVPGTTEPVASLLLPGIPVKGKRTGHVSTHP